MEKRTVLVCDTNKVFVKMFKKKLRQEFEFVDHSLLTEDAIKDENFDGLIFVVYNKIELVNLLKVYKRETNVLVCVFNEQLFARTAFLEEFSGVVLLDGSKTGIDLMADLRYNFKKALNFKQRLIESFLDSAVVENQLHIFFKNWIAFSGS
ncbi:hypothetical protein AB674_13095 [Flavobacterium sp. ABG]|nr:hypothetical protein AB674_13095 [Flavobacterium sp. ABG]